MKRRGVTKREVAASLGALALSAAMPLERGRAGRRPPDHDHRALFARHRHRHPGALDRDRPLATASDQPVVVDNRTGASGNIGTGMAARAAPDGNTLLMIAKVFVVNPSLFKSVPYDPVTSFDPIIKLATGTIVLAVHPSVPANDVREFVAYVKSQPPGSVNYGSAGFATPHHLSMELFKQAAGVNLTHIPVQGHVRRDDRPDRQPRQRHVHPDPCRDAVHARQANPRARHRRPRAFGGDAGRPDAARAGAERGRERPLVRAPRARRHAARDRRALQRRDQRDHPHQGDGRLARQAGPGGVRRQPRGITRSDRQGSREMGQGDRRRRHQSGTDCRSIL